MTSRVLIGLSVGSGLEGVDAAVVRAAGVGLDLVPRVERAVRVSFPPAARDVLRNSGGLTPPGSPELTRNVADTAVHAARVVLAQAGVSPRDAKEDRLLVHLGAAAGVLLVPAGAKVSAVAGFEAGPGNQLLDTIVYHGSRGREPADPGGKKAVQGCCSEPLLARWLDHPYLTRQPPKAVHPEAFGKTFLLAAFDAARQHGAGLPDLLCTATHLVARSVGDGCRRWLPPAAG